MKNLIPTRILRRVSQHGYTLVETLAKSILALLLLTCNLSIRVPLSITYALLRRQVGRRLSPRARKVLEAIGVGCFAAVFLSLGLLVGAVGGVGMYVVTVPRRMREAVAEAQRDYLHAVPVVVDIVREQEVLVDGEGRQVNGDGDGEEPSFWSQTKQSGMMMVTVTYMVAKEVWNHRVHVWRYLSTLLVGARRDGHLPNGVLEER